ncbi:HNH endonuclease signature motif containing protein [Paenibacillus sp. FSL R5-0519]|uniref:HNH endonuclease n=1 Tax=Paenibacillus sp. FSL R5-0519 TaxID=2921648 RepID=UPI0030D766E2
MKGVKGFQKGHKHSEETKKKISAANNRQVKFNCDYCGKESADKLSSFNKKKRHFCCRSCYTEYRKHKLEFQEHNAYKGVRKVGESKQVYHRKYYKNNPINIARLKAARYQREKNAEGSHTEKEWQLVKERHNNKCAMCKEDKFLTKDHIIPLSKGGSDYIENIQPLCRNCNSKKHDKILGTPTLTRG